MTRAEKYVKSFKILPTDSKGFIDKEYLKMLVEKMVNEAPVKDVDGDLVTFTFEDGSWCCLENYSQKEFCANLTAGRDFAISYSTDDKFMKW